MLVDFKTKDSKNAMLVAVFFHIAIILLFFLFISFKAPDPPLGTEMVSLSLADFGMDDTGQGETESESPSEVREEVVDEQVSQTTEEIVESTPEPVVTQETSVVTKPTATTTSTPKPEAKPEPTVSNNLSDALSQINSSGGGGSDGQNGGTGNVGNTSGHIDGKGVFGDGEGGWDLTGRGLVGKPVSSEKPLEDGTVVVNIYVDKSGNVTKAVINVAKSNTTSPHLFALAKKAAKTAKFSSKSNAAITQKGTITFHYKLK